MKGRGLVIRGIILIVFLIFSYTMMRDRMRGCTNPDWQQFKAAEYTFCYPPKEFGAVVLGDRIQLTAFFVVNDQGKARTCTLTLQNQGRGKLPNAHFEIVMDSLHPPIPEKRQKELIDGVISSVRLN